MFNKTGFDTTQIKYTGFITELSIESHSFYKLQDRVILGTDYPFPLGEVYGFAGAYPGKVVDETKGFDVELKNKILFKNALNFLNLDESKYI